ncbi:MAG TPA: cytochrome c oxidase subunit II [Bryocella sp.]|nr:cytochrome c oxidase subunit II [Bryocella sp.]
MWQNFPLFPPRASALAWQVDGLYFLLIAVSAFFSLLIFLTIFVFAVKYRRERHPHAAHIEGSLALELAWTLIPLGICMIFFAWGSLIYFQEARPPKGSMEIYCVAKQWMWKFEHEGGQREINQLHIPVGQDVKVILSSQDVIHSFFVPAFRVKTDVLPGRYTATWFRATKPGSYHLFCSQYCGTQHSAMIGEVVVMDPVAFQTWLANNTGSATMAASGAQTFTQLGCSGCHRSDIQGRGPSLAGLFSKPVQLEDGRTVVADENYIRESILNPGVKVVAGFKPIMPSYQGQVSEENLAALVAYIKSLAQPPQPQQSASNRPPAPETSKVQ